MTINWRAPLALARILYRILRILQRILAGSTASDIITHKQKRKEKSAMRHRAKTRKSVDRRIFARTAMKTKKMNVNPKILRGGIML